MCDAGEIDIHARVDALLNRHPAVGLALGVVRDGRLESFVGRGLADVAAGTPIGEDTVFRIASITKTFTAVAVMQLQERGLIDLDAPARDYLRAFELRPQAGWRPATVRDLLTHTAGVPETVQPWHVLLPDFGESVKAGSTPPSLAEFYGGGLRLEAEPGTRFIYGNHSPATLGQIVTDVSGQPLREYFRDHILLPLGMSGADLAVSPAVAGHLATGYRLHAHGPVAVVDREYATAAAASLCVSPRDMGRYLAALLNGGANEHGRILRPESVAAMFAPQYQPDPRVAGMGLAFFRVNLPGGRAAVEHSGLLPGFDSQVILAPQDGVAVMAFTNGTRRGVMWLGGEVQRLLVELIGAPAESARTDIPHHPEVWADLCGWYKLSAGIRDLRLQAFMGLGIEVFIRQGQPTLRFLTPVPMLSGGFPLYPDDRYDPTVFRMDFGEMGMPRVAFGTAAGGGVNAVTFDHPLMPLRLTKQPSATNPRRWAMGSLAAVGTAGAAAAIMWAARK